MPIILIMCNFGHQKDLPVARFCYSGLSTNQFLILCQSNCIIWPVRLCREIYNVSIGKLCPDLHRKQEKLLRFTAALCHGDLPSRSLRGLFALNVVNYVVEPNRPFNTTNRGEHESRLLKM